jgi:tetratricopeptide (TPR) repeat protein
MRPAIRVAALVLLALAACQRTPTPPVSADAAAHTMPPLPSTTAGWAEGAVLLDGIGTAHRPVSTRSAEAQRYFDQGLRLMWAFNHDEATRSFAKAAALDPDCGSCYWGVALTVGPNYNLPFLAPERAKVAFEATALAASHAAGATPVEQELIAALAKRYPNDRPLDPAATLPVLTAFAGAMRDIALRHPQDLDVQTLYAESLMNLNAWRLWTPDGRAAPGTDEIVALLEGVLARDPSHAGANHYYIHAIEASPQPEKALAAADRVAALAPAAGHLVHMPAHILQRVGRYEDAAEANRRAARADDAYDAKLHPPDYYPVMYTAHNYQFLAYSAAMEGRREETIAAVEGSRRTVSDAMLVAMPGTDWYVAELYTARVRFGMWDELIAMTEPAAQLPGLVAAYRHARVVALAARGRIAEADGELARFRAWAATVPADAGAGQNSLRDVLAIALPVAEARLALAKGELPRAIGLLRAAATAEDGLRYDEPKNWLYPVRHLLGAALLQAGDARAAERTYREDLAQNPGNGWSLFGLGAALAAQGRQAESEQAGREFESAWKHADVTLTASAF